MSWALPLVLLFSVAFAALRGIKTYDEFAEGAMDGLRAILRAAPNICAAVICIGLLRRSGLMEKMAELCGGFFDILGMPRELAPLAFLRPLSGGASLSLLQQIFADHGADSYIARTAAAMMGSTETVFYTMAVYLSGVKTKGSGWAIAIALLACLMGGVFAAAVCRIF